MRKWIRRISLAVVVCGIAACAWYGVQNYLANQREAQAGVAIKPSIPDGERVIDFDELRMRNEDIVAWLEIGGTGIDHPVVQGRDNDYYLGTDVNRRASKFGALFLDFRVRADFSDFNSVIYGHHIRNNTRMFHDLVLFKDKAFFDWYRTGTLYTPARTIPFEIFAVALTDPYAQYYRYDILTPGQREDYLDYIKESAMHYRDIGVGIQDHVLILSTCSYEFEDARTLVAAKLS